MKAKLIFDLNDADDRQAHLRAIKALELCLVINEITSILRKYRKHVDMTEEQHNLFNKLDDEIIEAIYSRDINLGNLIS